MELSHILAQMTLRDKIRLCSGADFWHTKAMPQYGIPSFAMADGPHGLRVQAGGKADMLGINRSLPATCFPTAVTAGASWDEALLAAEGAAIGEEALSQGVSLVLGPGCNIKRSPLCGRNFEYFSEDPFLSGKLAAAFIRGQQSTGVSSCVKHFAANNQEYKRMNGDSRVDDRALREIYLAPFETAVKEGRPDTVMCSYNKLNGTHASDHAWLLTTLLREEWGFSGMVVSDWGGLSDRIRAFQAGCDLSMPGGVPYMEKAAERAVEAGDLPAEAVEASAARVLALAFKAQTLPLEGTFDQDDHHGLALRVACEGAVLLQNEDSLLPVRTDDMVLIGSMARDLRYQGAGSSHINPTRVVSLTDALPQIPFLPCGDKEGQVSPAELLSAAQAAQQARVAVVVAGLPASYESEGFDRESLALPQGYVSLIETVARANPNTAVVLVGGGPMETSWRSKVKSILYLGLPGQAGGEACARLLTGRAVPSGKLTESWPESHRDVICRDTFGQKDPEYRESIYVGYRYYDTAQKPVAFPFGHGLSYTQFSYSGLTVSLREVSALITNTGDHPGAEVVQLYIAPPPGGLHRPVRELKGFARVELAPGESKRVSFPLNDRSFALWDNGWKVPGGTYRVQVASSSRDLRLAGELVLPGPPLPRRMEGSWYETMKGTPSRQEWEALMGRPVPLRPEPRRGQFTLDNSCMEMRNFSRIMALQYWLTEGIISLGFHGRRDHSDPAFRMMVTCAADCPLRSMVISSRGLLREWMVRLLLALANGFRPPKGTASPSAKGKNLKYPKIGD